jgi:hypothetical protein
MFEAADLRWFVELCYANLPSPHLFPSEPAAVRNAFSDVGLVDQFREVILQLKQAISLRPIITLRNKLPPKLLSGELSVASYDRISDTAANL